MKTIRFVHCSDLHIDSPMERISSINSALGELLRQSTYESFNNIIDMAIRESVDCVLISGDIYNSADKSLKAQLKFRDGLNRLSNKGIPTFIVHGNHDPLNSWSAKLDWPNDVFIFPGDRVECLPLVKNGEMIAQICGISFAERDIFENLALKFKRKRENVPRIGLLHTNIGTNTGHAPYAPCTVADLTARGMDYWALGHIHAHNILKASNPAIVYAGCSQSTHSGQTGEKGCCLVTVEPGIEPDIRFIPTDTVRYKSDFIDITNCLTVDEIISSIKEKCERISVELSNRHAIIRLSLAGRNDLNLELHKGSVIDDLVEHIRDYFEGRTPYIWLEKLILNTAGAYDLEVLRRGNDFAADIISICDGLEDSKSEYWKDVQEKLSSLFTNWPGQKYLDKLSESELLELVREARNSILDILVRTE